MRSAKSTTSQESASSQGSGSGMSGRTSRAWTAALSASSPRSAALSSARESHARAWCMRPRSLSQSLQKSAARALALGARVTAMALPVLRAAQNSTEATVGVLREFEQGLRVSMFLTGARTVKDLASVPIRIAPSLFPEVYEGHRSGENYWNRSAPLLGTQE